MREWVGRVGVGGRIVRARRGGLQGGFSIFELMAVVAILAILVLIALPVFRASTTRAATAVLEKNTRLIDGRVSTLAGQGFNTTYRRSGVGNPNTHLSRRLEQEVVSPPTASTDDIQSLRNPVSGNSNVVNQNSINVTDPTPPALFITSGATYRYDRIRTNPSRLAGTILVVFNNPTGQIETFFMDEQGERSTVLYTVKMNN